MPPQPPLDERESPPASSVMAGVGRRLIGMVYEALLVAAVLLGAEALFTPLFIWLGKPLWLNTLNSLYLILVLGAYFVWPWTRSGQTLPMQTWRMRLTDEHGDLVHLPRAVLRFVLASLMLAPGLLSPLWIKATKQPMAYAVPWLILTGACILWAQGDRQRRFLYDRLAGTQVMLLPRPSGKASPPTPR